MESQDIDSKVSISHQKRNRAPSEPPTDPDNSSAKKPKADERDDIDYTESVNSNLLPPFYDNNDNVSITSDLKSKGNPADDSTIGNESDSDADYDDLDELVLPSDNDDLFEDEDEGVDLEDDARSVTSTATTMSTGSVGSNTPSLVGESLESVSIGPQQENAGIKKKLAWVSQAPNLTDSPALRRSLFPNIPPTINFMLHNEMSAHQLPDDLRKHLKWKLSNITPAIVKRCAGNSGFRLMRKTCTDWGATWGKHMKSGMFKEVKEAQKINHFPGTFNIGRKDRLWKNYHRLMMKHGKTEFGFLPRTFCLPADTKLLRKVWERKGGKGRWIVKPPALARGTGIKVVNKWSQIPRTRPLVVQRYVARPYLINETKFDLRLYVLMTSVNPLRLYLYDDGLVRFASHKYTNESTKVDDVFTHLTNYSINKNSATYMTNEDSASAQGHKWTLKSLWRHFDEEGIDHTEIWEKIKDLMIKTVISAENSMATLFSQNLGSRYSCYELFGFDILLDSKLKPWLIEVNISPSLHSTSSLDLDVKSPLATEVFNMARYHIPNRLRLKDQKEIASKMGYKDMTMLCHERRLYVKEISKAEKIKHDTFIGEFMSTSSTTGNYLPPMGLLDHLTPDDSRHLVVSEDELATSRRFTRIFPTSQSFKYFRFLEKPRYYNLLLAAWEQRYSGINREAGRTLLENLCLSKHHLKVPANVYVKKTALGTQETIDISGLAAPAPDALVTNTSEQAKTDQGSQDSGLGDSQTDAPLQPPSTTFVSNSKESSSDSSCIKPPDKVDTASNVTVSSASDPVNKFQSHEEDPKESPSRKVKMSSVRVVAKPHNVKIVSPGANWPSRKEKDSQSDPAVMMECGSDTPSPKGTPEHPGMEDTTMIKSNEVMDNRQMDTTSPRDQLDNLSSLNSEPLVDNRPLLDANCENV